MSTRVFYIFLLKCYPKNYFVVKFKSYQLPEILLKQCSVYF